MEKFAWKGYIKEGCFDEYCRRHDEIWPELVEVMKKAGMKNYTVWNIGNELFGYYECENGIDYATKVKSESPVIKKWDEYMSDILIMDKDPVTNRNSLLKKVFEMD